MMTYTRQCLAFLLMLAVATAIFNIWADPYNIYRFTSTDSDRMSRVSQSLSMRLSKPWQVFQGKPKAALIGSSRTGSISTGHGDWQHQPAFNLSMVGLTMYEMLPTIKHAQENGPLSELIIGLEHETFILSSYKTGLGFAEGRLANFGSWKFLLQALRDFRDTTLTASVITRSTMAVAQREELATRYFPDGHWENRSRIWRGESGYISVGKNMLRLLSKKQSVYGENLERFEAILRYCHRKNIALTLFISPEHIFLTDLRRTAGASHLWQNFHRELININDQVAQEEHKQPFPLWGFNHLQGIVDERLPRGNVKPGAWFRDGIHFTSELGELLMAHMQKGGGTRGFPLELNTIDGYFDAIESVRLEFEKRAAVDIQHYEKKIL